MLQSVLRHTQHLNKIVDFIIISFIVLALQIIVAGSHNSEFLHVLILSNCHNFSLFLMPIKHYHKMLSNVKCRQSVIAVLIISNVKQYW